MSCIAAGTSRGIPAAASAPAVLLLPRADLFFIRLEEKSLNLYTENTIKWKDKENSVKFVLHPVQQAEEASDEKF